MEVPAQPCDEKSNKNVNSEDQFSLLPEDVVFNILSRLTMKEAVLTSILSTKWRYSWRFFTGFMDFYASDSLDMESHRFLSWVNRVLRSHEAPTLEGLRVCFCLDSDSQYEIDSWIKFALQKRVKHLQLDLTTFEPRIRGLYVFPSNLNILNHSNFSSLKSLRLRRVDVTGEILQHLLLSCCPFLEVLSVTDSPSLVGLKVSGLSLRLKHLEIGCYFSLKELDISAASLVSFDYYGPKISIPFNNVPNLVEVSFGGSCSRFIVDYTHQFSHHKLRIETLKLNLGNGYLFRNNFPWNFPTLGNVKHLEVTAAVFTHESCLLPPCAALLKACPLLHTFKLEVSYEILGYSTLFTEIPKDHTQLCLKVVQVLGFLGNVAEVMVVEYLLRNAPVLEKMIIGPCSPKLKETNKYQSARQCAPELERKVSPRVEFVVL